jgi:hypothetical protein
MNRFILITVFALALSLIACVDITTPCEDNLATATDTDVTSTDTNVESNNNPEPQCAVDSDCADGKVCSQETCVNGQCLTLDDCTAFGQVCYDTDQERSSSGLKFGCGDACQADTDCHEFDGMPVDQLCQAGACAVYPTDCATDADCSGDYHCVSGHCNFRGCVEDSDCSNDFSMICEHHLCQPSECTQNEECNDGVPCTGDLCVAGRCGSYDTCLQGVNYCSHLTGFCEKPCETDSDCPELIQVYCDGPKSQTHDITLGTCSVEKLCDRQVYDVTCDNKCVNTTGLCE